MQVIIYNRMVFYDVINKEGKNKNYYKCKNKIKTAIFT